MERRFERRRARIFALASVAALSALYGCDKSPYFPFGDGTSTWEDQPDLPPDDEFPLSQEVWRSEVAPPPISGGTLMVTRDGGAAVAADPDRDRVLFVNLKDRSLAGKVLLEPGDEPGRVVEGAAGFVHVALRRGGAVLTADLAGQVVKRRSVCPAPRGMAYDESKGLLFVACAGGELVTLSDDLEAPKVRELRLDRDLRDVVIDGEALLVSRFRSAELLVVEQDGSVSERRTPGGFSMSVNNATRAFEPAVAWRTIPLPGGGAAMVHQRALVNSIDIQGGGLGTPAYSGFDCASTIVHGAVTMHRPKAAGGGGEPPPPEEAVGGVGLLLLPVDMAISRDGHRAAVVAAGGDVVMESLLTSLEGTDSTCFVAPDQRTLSAPNEPIAVAYDAVGNILVQTREPSGLMILGAVSGFLVGNIDFGGASRRDSGHALFHRNPDSPSPIACASCHPEGTDDGRVWNFNPIGGRRTQAVGGGVLETAPLHWDGDMADMSAIMTEVFEHRMGGFTQSAERLEVFEAWLSTVPRLPTSQPVDAQAALRGEALFKDAEVGCSSCHSGARLTNNATVDVGTGKAFQVPSLLGLAARAPYMHDGCAETIRDRFGPCGGGDKHGVTSKLTDAQIDDLVAYLESL